MTEAQLAPFFAAMVFLLVGAHGLGYAFERWRLPRVIGEIAAGIVLGPAVLGLLLPSIYQGLFHAFPDQTRLLSVLYWTGLVLLMFISGFHLPERLSGGDRRIVGILVSANITLPFALGWALPELIDLSALMAPGADPAAFRLVVAIATAVTSIPVISKIFLDLGIAETRFARVVLTTSMIEDVFLWVALAIATGLAAHRAAGVMELSRSVVVPLAFFALAVWFGPRLVAWIGAWRINFVVKASPMGYVLSICLLSAALSGLLEVNVAFGALAAGIVVGALDSTRFGEARTTIQSMARAFLIPLYFALVGTRIDLLHAFDPGLTLLFLSISSTAKIVSVMIGARLARLDSFTGLNLSLAMNARGGPGIVLATVAFEAGLISEVFFTALVISSLATSLISGVWFRFVVGRGLPLMKD